MTGGAWPLFQERRLMISAPSMNGRSASGITTDPSAC
jgi:hypothetical protein